MGWFNGEYKFKVVARKDIRTVRNGCGFMILQGETAEVTYWQNRIDTISAHAILEGYEKSLGRDLGTITTFNIEDFSIREID